MGLSFEEYVNKKRRDEVVQNSKIGGKLSFEDYVKQGQNPAASLLPSPRVNAAGQVTQIGAQPTPTQIPTVGGSGGRGVGPRPEQKQTSGGGVLGAIKGFFQELRPSKVLQGAREYQNVANQSSVDGQIDPIEAAAFGAARPALSLGETAVRALDGGKDPRVAEDLDRLKLMEQTARQTQPVAYGAGSVVGTLPIMSGISGALGSVSAIEGLSPLVKGAALGGGARAALEAISGAGDVAGGRVSAGEYARNVASAGAGGAAGGAAAAGLSVIGNAVLNKLVSMPYLNMAAAPNLPGAVNKTITALERFGLNNNGLARAIVAGLSGVNFAAADTAASRAAMKILGGENPKMSASEYYTRLLVAGGFGALSYLAGVYENPQVRQYAEQGAEAYTAAQEAASAGNAEAYSEALTVLNNSAANISTIVASGAIPAAEAVQAADIISGVVASMTTATANTPTVQASLPETGSAGAILPPPTGEANVPPKSPVDSEFVIEALDKIAGAITNKQPNALNALNALGAERPTNGVVMPRAGEQLQTLRDRGIMNTKEGAQYGAEEIQRTGRDVYVPRGSERAPAESRVERSGGLGEAAERAESEGYLARADEATPGGTEREAQAVLSGTEQQVTVAADAKDKDVGGVTIARTEDAAKVMPGLKAGTTVGVVSGNDTAAIKAAKARDAKSGIKTTYVAGGSFTTADGKQGRGACVKYHDGHVEMLVAVDDPQADANQINAHEHGHLAVMTGKLNVRDTVDAFRDTYTHGADAANMIIDTYLQLDGISPDDTGVYAEKDLEELLCNALGNINAFEGMSTFDPLSAGLRDLRKFILDRLDPDTRSWFDDNVKAAPTSTKIAPQTNVGKSEAAEPAKARPPTVKESAKQNIRMVDGAAVTPDVEKVMESPDYEPPVDYMKLSVNTRDAWKKSYLEQFNSKDAERVAKVVDMFTDKMIANDAIMGYVPIGSYKYDSKGPLRGNIEYIVTYDMDTSCPRTFQFINYRDALQAIAGRPLNYKESINLLELMRAYGQQIPCAYCYVENKRVLLSSSYNNFFAFRQNVMNADTDADALKQMYSYNAKKGKVSDAAKKVFDTWRADRSYNPSVQEVWNASQASRNAVLNYLDARRSAGTITDKTSTKAVMDMVKKAFNLSDNGAVTEVASYVADWMYDTDAKIQHIYTVPNTENATVDEKALALHHEALAYAKSASSAKSVENYAPYTDQLKNISQKDKDYINGMGGIRKHSSNDFRMDYVQDYIMFFADLAAGKWMGHTYTKSTDYVKVFGRTGDRINMSIAMYGGENGTAVRQNLDEGMAWKDARELRKAYKNAGVMAMVTNNAQLSYALNTEDFVDMIIPFHASGLDKAVWYNLRMWNDYTSKQLERFLNAKDMKAALKEKRIEIPKGAKAAEIRELYDKEFHIKKIYAEDGTLVKPHFLPGDTYVNGQLVPGHHNDVKLYKKLCAEYGVHPRFDGVMVTDKNGKTINVVDHPNYIRLVKETARTDSEQTPIQFNFDEEDPFLGMTPLDYAMERMEQEAKNGGYENTKNDPYGIVREFREQYLGKDRPLGYLTERAKEYQAIREGQQREAQEKLDKELQVDEIKLSQGSKRKPVVSVKTVNGKSVAWVENSGLSNAEIKDHKAVADFIADHIGEYYTILESGQKVYIGEDLPDEYTQSQYTTNLKNRDRTTLKAKNKGAAAIGDMIEIATNRRWEQTRHAQSKDAKYGMYRYDSSFAFPARARDGSVTNVRAYDVELLIRNASDGKKYLYDIVNIKENTSSALDLLNKETRKGGYAAARGSVSTDTIADTSTDVKTEEKEDASFSASTRNQDITRLQNENKRLKKQVEYWQGQTKATEGWKADAKQEAKVTREILKSTSSKLDADETTRRITQLHEDLSNGKLTYEEGKAAATQIASDIVNKSSAMVSKSTESYRAAQKIIKSTPQIDLAYSRLQQELGKDVFPDALSTQEKQDTIREVMDSLKPVIDNPYDLNKAIVIESVADDIINAGMEMRQAAPTVVDVERAKTAEAKAEGARAVEEQRKLDQMYYNRKMAEIRRQRDEKVEKILQHQREVRQNARERKQEASDRQMLLRLAKRFQSNKIDPVTKAQLPDIVKVLDTVAVHLTGRTLNELTKIRQMYEAKTNPKSAEYDPNYIPDNKTISALKRLEEIPIESLDIQDVRDLINVLRNIEHNMTEARNFQRSQLRIDNYEAGMRFINDIDNAQKGGINRELNPLRAARRMAGYNDGAIEGTTESPVITLMKECIKGEREARLYTREATKMLSKYLNDKPFMRKLYGRRAQEIMITGYDARTGEKKSVAITPAMRISLYLHSLNDDNMRHIQNGGVLIPDMRQYKRGNMAEAYAADNRLLLTKTNVASICANMTEQERGFARALWRYFNEYAPKSLNETSVELDGYEKFLEENYFPINVDRNFIGQDFQEMVMDDKGSLTHPGFGEERAQSSKPIYLRDANEIFSNAVRQNAAYACKAVPLSNLNKLVNVQQVGAVDSVQAALARQFTANAKNPVATSGSDYLAKFMRDYAGNKGGKKSGTDKLLAKIRSNYAGAVLTLAGGTAIKQAASYPTAASVVSAKSLAQALNPARTVDTSFIDERTATFTQRTEGYSSIEQAELSQKGKHIPKALNWIQAVDVATTKALKRAAAIEVQNTTNLKIGTEEYKQAVVDMYERIIEETQPNYSTALRPDILRSDSALERALVMFATQPMQNFGILYDAVNDYGAKQRAYKNTGSAEAKAALKNSGKTLGKAIGSQLASALVFALMQAAYDWYRKKDDKYKDEGEVTWGSFAKGLGLTMASTGAGMFIGGKVLLEFAEVFADEIASKTGGKKYFGANAYGFDVAELEAITDATKSAINAVDAISGAIGSAAEGEDVNYEVLARKIWSAAEDAAKLAGIPAENATTMITSAAKQVMEATMGEYIGDYYALRIGASPDSSKAAFYDNLYACWNHASNAKLRELYDIMLGDGFTPDGIKSAMETRAKKAQGVKSVKELKNRWPYK